MSKDILIVEQYKEKEKEKEKYVLVTIQLSSGISASIKYPFRSTVNDFVSVSVGKLKYLDKNYIVIEITDESSGCGSSDIHILHVENKDGKALLVEELTIMDAMKESPEYQMYENTYFELPSKLVSLINDGELILYRDDIEKVH